MLLAAGTAGLVGPRAAIAQEAATIPASPAATVPVAPIIPLDEAIRAEVATTIQTLNDPVATQAQHDEAARRLADRSDSPAAMSELKRVLADRSNVRGQLAVATVVAEMGGTDPSFVDPLVTLLGPDPRLSAVAAGGLASFKSNPTALAALTNFARTAPAGQTARQFEQSRIAAIEALGTMLDKPAAATLIDLARSDLESDVIRTAATTALGAMSGRADIGRDLRQWDAWWATTGALSDADFRNAILTVRAARADAASRAERSLATRLREALGEQYAALPRESRPAALARFLNDESPIVRSLGASLVVDEARNANPPTVATRERLRAMVGDSDARVRIDVAATLRSLNDQGAVDALRVQLAQETNTDAMLAQIAALGTTADPRAVPSVLPLVDHPSDVIAMAAVRALGPLGNAVRQTDPATARTLREKLVSLIRGRAAKAGAETLRAAAVTALAPVADRTTTPLLLQLLGPREATPVRIAVCNALAVIGDPNAADRIADLFDPRTTDRDVRLAAVRAMGSLGSFEYAPALLNRMRETEEPDPDVRATAAASIDRILPSGNKRSLKELAERFRDDPVRRLNVQRELVAKLQRDNDTDLAYELLNLAELQGLEPIGQYREAAVSSKAALDMMLGANAPNQQVERLILQYIRAVLRSDQYTQAVSFATTMIQRDPSNAETIGREVVREVERMRKAGNLEAALRLVNTFKPLKMPLYSDQLAGLEAEMQQELNRKTNTRPTSNALAPEIDTLPEAAGTRLA
jgi:HEAT repeat protein